jgi:hypothetical protein
VHSPRPLLTLGVHHTQESGGKKGGGGRAAVRQPQPGQQQARVVPPAGLDPALQQYDALEAAKA